VRLAALALALAACGTHLSSTDTQAEETTATLAAATYHEADGGIVGIRAHAIYCNSSAILARAHVDAAAPPGAPECK
jgi:hypothetical protein